MIELKADACPCGSNVLVRVMEDGQDVGTIYLEVSRVMANTKGKARYCENIGQAVTWVTGGTK